MYNIYNIRPECSLKYYISKIMVWFFPWRKFRKEFSRITRKEKQNRKINLIWRRRCQWFICLYAESFVQYNSQVMCRPVCILYVVWRFERVENFVQYGNNTNWAICWTAPIFAYKGTLTCGIANYRYIWYNRCWIICIWGYILALSVN